MTKQQKKEARQCLLEGKPLPEGKEGQKMASYLWGLSSLVGEEDRGRWNDRVRAISPSFGRKKEEEGDLAALLKAIRS